MPDQFDVILTAEAQADLDGVTDNRTYAAIESKIDELTTEPDKRGKALSGSLTEYRVVRAAGQRYRVVYQVAALEGVVTVVVIGIRKEGDKRDAYRIAQRRLG